MLVASGAWRDQLDCHLVQTNDHTHETIRANLDRAPMYNGGITSAGPRYCPSIETKIVRFADKSSHHLFLEPEGWNTREVYVQGANTSLPEDVQLAMLRTIPALRDCQIMRAGYAIEYDYLPGTQVSPTLQSKLLPGLYLAGQIIGTTGYEEAAALGIIAGINAACYARNRDQVVLRRDQAYIGVLIDDLVTKQMDEPYRMHTSQAEFRLLLRQDNAEQRLGHLAHRLGLVSDEQHAELLQREAQISAIVSRLDGTWLPLNAENLARLEALGCRPSRENVRARDFLARNDVHLDLLQELGLAPRDLSREVVSEVETTVKYAGYVARQQGEVERLRKLETHTIPNTFDYGEISGLRAESQEKLSQIRPRTIGQAARVAGVTSQDISILLVKLEQLRRASPT
jgi:tRNA uridine 5-carboxymethylaminomethyl modification enzyme